MYWQVSKIIDNGNLSSTNAKMLIEKLLGGDQLPLDIERYAESEGLIQNSDEGEIAKIVSQVLEQNSQAAEDVKNGETKAIGFLVGQVMKLSQGKANPGLAQELIKKQLGL